MTESAKKRILAVDDSRVSLMKIQRLLESTDYTVIASAQSGVDAIEQYKKVNPDIVLLDIVMPDMDGVGVLERLRETDANARVIMVSSMGTQEKVSECVAKGAKSFLMKPYEKDDLLRVLETLVLGEGL